TCPDLCAGRLVEHLRVVLERECGVTQAALDFADNGGEAAAADVCHDVQAAGHGVASDDGGTIRHADVSNLAQGHVSAVRPVDQQAAYLLDAASCAGRALNDDIEDLLLREDAADL